MAVALKVGDLPLFPAGVVDADSQAGLPVSFGELSLVKASPGYPLDQLGTP
jgi:hypothetical protein